MNRIPSRRAAAFWTALFSCINFACSAAHAAPPLERAVPGDCFMVLTVRDVPGLLQRAHGLSIFKAAADPAMAPYANGVKTELKKLFSELNSSSGFDFEHAINYFKGQVLMAFHTQKDEDKNTVQTYLLVEVGADEEAVRGFLERWSARAVKDGSVAKRVAGEITTITPTKNPRGSDGKMAYAVRGGVLVAASTPEMVARTMRALASGLPNSLTENVKVRRFREGFARQAKGLGDVEFYLTDFAPLTPPVKEGPVRQDPSALSNFSGVGFNALLAKGDFESLFQLVLVSNTANPSDLTGLIDNKPLKIEPWVPDSALSYSTVNLDADKLYAWIVKTMDKLSPGYVAQMEERLAEFPTKANPLLTSFQKDLVEPLGNRITLVTDRGEYGGRPVERALLAWQLRNSDRISRMMEGLVNVLGTQLQITTKTVKGYSVYSFPAVPRTAAPPRRGAPAATTMPFEVGAASFAVTKTHLLFATHVEVFDRVLNYEGQPGLSESPAASKTASKFPANPAGIYLMRAEEIGKRLFETLREEQLSKTINDSLAANDSETAKALRGLVKAIKGDKLPPFDLVKQYFRSPTGGFFVNDDSGLRFVFYSVRQ